MRADPARLVLPVVIFFMSSACIDLELQHEVKDLRILAMRLDPPEVLYSPFLAFPADQRPPVPGLGADIEATVLAVDPRGPGGVEFVSHACPASDNVQCRNYEIDAETREAEHDLAELEASLAPLLKRRSVMLHPDQHGTISGSLGHYSFDARSMEFVLPHDAATGAASILFQQYARILVRARSRGVEEVAFRRIPFNVSYDFTFLPPAVAAEMQGQFSEFLGVEFCDAAQSLEPSPSCLKVRGPNNNPSIVEFRYSREGVRPQYDDQDDDTLEFGEVASGPITMNPGEEIILWPVLARGDNEHYQVFEINLQEQTLSLGNYKEQMAVSWYSSQDMVRPPISALVSSRDLAVNYTYPVVDSPSDVRLWVVVLDQRGGTTWGHVGLEQK